MYKKQKKRNYFAEKVLEIAKERKIPLDEEPELRKILFKLEFDNDVPSEFYKVIVEILVVCNSINYY